MSDETDRAGDQESEPSRSPLDMLDVLAAQDVEITADLRHVEIYTPAGLLTMLWHGPIDAENMVLMGGGALGGLLGPAGATYHRLGVSLAEQGIGSMRISYRRPNDLPACVLDMGVAADLSSRSGARNFVTVGHSFGGAVAIQAAQALGAHTKGVVTLATQSAGCENGDRLATAGTPVLHLHGDNDSILPHAASEMVQMLTGGELVILPGADHRFSGAEEELATRLGEWIPARFEPASP